MESLRNVYRKINKGENTMSGKRAKSKGTRREREFAKLIGGERVYGSGAFKQLGDELTGDVEGLGMKFEVKARKDGFKQLYQWLEKEDCVDALALKADHKQWLVVLPIDTFLELATKRSEIDEIQDVSSR